MSYHICIFLIYFQVQLELIDGESIAIDWHMVVFEEMIDTAAIMKVVQHATTDDSDGQKRYRRSQPLSRCLNKVKFLSLPCVFWSLSLHILQVMTVLT